MASQIVPGVAILRASGYAPPISPIIATASGVSALGIGSAFWGLVAGAVVMAAMRAWRGPREH